MLLILALFAIAVVGMLVITAASRSPQTRGVGRRARRGGLGVFFVSVAVNAALGVYAVLTTHFGDTAGDILGTSLCVTGAILVALCCEPAWERRLLTPVPVVGALLGSAAFAGLIVRLWAGQGGATGEHLLASTFAVAIGCTLASVVVLERSRIGISRGHTWAITLTLGVIALEMVGAIAVIWAAPSSHTVSDFAATGGVLTGACLLADVLTLFHPAPATRRVLNLTLGLIAAAAGGAIALIWTTPSSGTVGNFTGTCWITAFACALAALLTHARLGPGHRWVLAATLVLLAAGAALSIGNIWVDVWGLTRGMGVTLVTLAAFVVTVPVLHWVDRRALATAAATSGAISHCPYCGRTLGGEVGVETQCARCERTFTVIEGEWRGADTAAVDGHLGVRRPADGARTTAPTR